MPVNPPRKAPPVREAAERIASTARVYHVLIAIEIAIVGTFTADHGMVLPGAVLIGLAGLVGSVRR